MRPARPFKLGYAITAGGIKNQHLIAVLHGYVQRSAVRGDAKPVGVIEAKLFNRIKRPKNFSRPQVVGANRVLTLLRDEKTARGRVGADPADHAARHGEGAEKLVPRGNVKDINPLLRVVRDREQALHRGRRRFGGEAIRRAKHAIGQSRRHASGEVSTVRAVQITRLGCIH